MVLQAWTSDLMDSPLALDPIVGLEILQSVEQFLRLRSNCMALIRPPTVQEYSQDEFDTIDPDFFNDPAFNQILGEGGGEPSEQQQQSGPRASEVDAKFAEVSHKAPLLFFFRVILSDRGLGWQGRLDHAFASFLSPSVSPLL
jgi:hypothetical protein